MMRQIPSLRLLRRTVEVETAYTLSRLKVLERIPGNPVGVAYRQIDAGAIALMAEHLPVASFNSVIGLRSGLEHHIAPLLAWYRGHDVEPQVELVPGYDDPALGRELIRCGFFQAAFHASLVCAPCLQVTAPGNVACERVGTARQLESFLDAYARGRCIPSAAEFKANVRAWAAEPGWSLYLARLDGCDAGAAILYVNEGVGYCADAAVDPVFRRRGVHTALLGVRIAEASFAGVDFVCAGAEFLSQSYRNMARAGMRVQFVRALWREL
jgi:hypothetical protein